MAFQHLRSSTASKRPTPAAMGDGQLAINTNTASPGLFFKDSSGALIKVGPVHVGSTAPNASPATGGETGNTVGEQWLDTSGTNPVFKIWDGSEWQSEAGEFVNTNGDTMTGNLVMNNANIVFEGATANEFETTLTVTDPTADRTITLPNTSGTVVTTGDTGTVTSTMIADGTIVNADVSGTAAIAGSKIDPDFGSQTVETTGVFSAAAGSNSAPSITFTGDLNTGIYSPGADQLALSVNGSEAVRVDASSRLLVGTSSARTNIGSNQTASIQTESTTNGLGLFTAYNQNNAFGSVLAIAKSRGTTVGSNTIVQSGDQIGGVFFYGADGVDTAMAARIECYVDGTPGSNDMPGRLVFSTTADGGSSPTERMRIDSDGTLLLGVNTKVIGRTTNPYLFFQAQSNVATAGMSIESYGNNIALRYHFAFTNPNGVVGTISTNGTATAYNTSSDYRLKENVVAIDDGITRLQQLKPSRFNFIADPAKTVDGFLAHEVQTIVPEAITGEKDAVDADGKPIYQGIDQSKLVPLLTAALQEAVAKIGSLEVRLTAAGL